MKLNDLLTELKILGVNEETDLALSLTVGKNGKFQEAVITAISAKKEKSKLALH